MLEYDQVCSNDCAGLTLNYFIARSNLVCAFVWGKGKNNGFFRNYCSLGCQSWYMQLTKWVHEPLWISEVKVIHWPPRSLKFNICTLLCIRNRQASWSQISCEALKNLLLWNKKTDDLGTWYEHWVFECSNDDSGLTLTYFMARSNFVPYAFFLMGKS